MCNTGTMTRLLGGSRLLSREIDSEMDLYEIAVRGIPKKAVVDFAKNIDISMKAMVAMLNTTERTLQRRKDFDLLDKDLSEHVLQLAEIYSRGEQVLENIENVKVWLETPNIAFNGKKPIDLISSRYGIQMIMEQLGRIEHGVFS